MLGIRHRVSDYVENKETYEQKIHMQGVLCGWRECATTVCGVSHTFAMLGIRRGKAHLLEKKQGREQKRHMQGVLCEAAGACEELAERDLEAKRLQVQRLRE